MSNESSDWTLNGLDNPFVIQHALLTRFREATGGVIVDNNNPACVLMEGFADTAGNQLRMMDDNVRPAIYPARAETVSDLLRHVSDYDYVDIFSSPCQSTIVLVVEKNYIMTHSVAVPGKNYSKVEIPRSTIIKLGEHTFGLYYPIEIRTNYKSGRFSVLYNDVDVNGNKQVNPLRRLETNVLDFEFREFNGHKLAYINIPVYQFEVTSHDSVLMTASGYKTKIPYKNKFYALRCYAEVLQNFGHDVTEEDVFKREELNLVVSGQTYDPTSPTVVFTPDSENNELLLEIPYIYFSEGRIRGTLHVDVYTTEGALDYQVPYGSSETCSIDMLSNISDDEEELFHATTYADPFRQMPALNAFPVTSHIVGGTNGLSYEELRKRVIHGVNSTLLQTPGDIDAYFATKGYTATLYRDGITDRVFVVHATLRDTEGVVVGADTISTLIDFSKIDDYGTIVKSDATNVYTVLPSTLYKFDADKNICVPLTDVERAVIENMTPAEKVEEFNNHTYMMSPFHLQINASNKYPSTITYDMLQVKRLARRFIAARDNQYGLALNGVNLDVSRRSGDVSDRYRMTLRVARVGFGSEVPVMETDPKSQGEKKIRVLIGLKNDDGEYRWTEALHIGNEAGDTDNSDNEIFECYFTPNYVFHQANNDHTVQMAFWDNTNYSDFFLKSECRIILLLRNSISFTNNETGEIITFDGDQHLETPFNSGSIVLPTSKSTPITSTAGMNGYVAMSEHACTIQFGSPVDELDQRINLTYSEAVYKTHKTTKFRVLEDDVYAKDSSGNLKVDVEYVPTEDTQFQAGKVYFEKNEEDQFVPYPLTVGDITGVELYERKMTIATTAKKGTLKCVSVKARELVYPTTETASNYYGCKAIDPNTGEEFVVTESNIQTYINERRSLTVVDAPLVPKFSIDSATKDVAGIYELTDATVVRSGISSMTDWWRKTGRNVNDTKIVTVNALKYILDNEMYTTYTTDGNGDTDPINTLYKSGTTYEPGTFLVINGDNSAPAAVQIGLIGEAPTINSYTRLYYKLRNRTSAESSLSESIVWMCIAEAKTLAGMKQVINADAAPAEGIIPKYYGFAYVLMTANVPQYIAFLTENSIKTTAIQYVTTEDSIAVSSKQYFIQEDDVNYRAAGENDFEEDGSFKSGLTYFEREAMVNTYTVPDFSRIDTESWESHVDYELSSDAYALEGRKYAYQDKAAAEQGSIKYVVFDVEPGTSFDEVFSNTEIGQLAYDHKVYQVITVAEAIAGGKSYGWETKGNRWPWDLSNWKIIDESKRLKDDEIFEMDPMFDRVKRYTEFSNQQVILDENGKPLNDFEKPRYIQYLVDMLQLDAKLAQITMTRGDLNIGSNFGDDGSTVNKYPSTVVATLRTHFDNVGNARDSMFTNTRLFFEPVKSLGYADFNVGNGNIRSMPLDIEIKFRLHVTKDVYEDDILLIQLRKRIVEIVDNHIDSGGYVNCAEIGNMIMREMGGSIKYVDILGINGDKDLQTMKAVSPEVRPHLKTKLVLLDDGVTIDSDRGIDIETVINE